MENEFYSNEHELSDLHYRIAELYRAKGNQWITEAIRHYEASSMPLSDSHRLELIYKYKNRQNFLDAEIEINEKGVATPLVGAVQSHASIRYNKTDKNLFCRNPFDFIYQSKLSSSDGFDLSLVDSILKQKDSLDRVNQSLLKNGDQSAGNFLLINDPSVVFIKNIITKKIDKYRTIFARKDDGFIKNWPKRSELHGWIVDIKKGGSLGSHMHKLGWLSGSLYLKIPKARTKSEGNIVFSLDGANYPSEGKHFPIRKLTFETGDIVLFLLQFSIRQFPFSSDDNRVTLAFDVKPIY